MRPAFNQSVALLGSLILLLGGCSDARDTDEALEDAAVTAVVKTRLAADPEVNPFEIDVDTTDGVVTLRGIVEDDAARREAIELARATDGVVRVISEIELGDTTPGQELDDRLIVARINGALVADDLTSPLAIDVDAVQGRVILSGTVGSEEARRRAETIARRAEGVRSVENRLEVLPENARAGGEGAREMG